MLYTDGNGFPLTLKPSHLFGSTERMDAAEVLSAIVEEACRFEPDSPVGEKSPKALTRGEQKEARTSVEQREALTSVKKVSMVASDLVRFKLFELACFTAVNLSNCLANLIIVCTALNENLECLSINCKLSFDNCHFPEWDGHFY